MLKTVWKHRGYIRITVRDLAGNILEQTELRNTVVKVGRKMWRDMLKGDIADGQIKQFGLGDDDTATFDDETTLVNETFRKAFTAESTPADDQYQTVCYIAPAEAVGWIKELGWFAGAGALASPNYNTGILVSRVLWSRNKTNLESIEIVRLDSVEEG